MELRGCEGLREAAHGCGVVLLCATEAEAAPVRAALQAARHHTVATKTIYMGELAAAVESAASVKVCLAISGCDKANAAHLLTCLVQALTPGPSLVLQFGIGGAFPSSGPGPGAGVGDIVIATQEIYSDTGSSSPERWYSAAELGLPIARVNGTELGGSFPLDVGLALAATDVIQALEWPDAERGGVSTTPESATWSTGVGRPGGKPAVLLGTCLTASRVTGLRGQAEQAAARWGALAESMEGAAAAHVCALHQVPFLEIRGISNLVVDRDRASWRVEPAAAIAGRAAVAVAAAVDGLPLGKKE